MNQQIVGNKQMAITQFPEEEQQGTNLGNNIEYGQVYGRTCRQIHGQTHKHGQENTERNKNNTG